MPSPAVLHSAALSSVYLRSFALFERLTDVQLQSIQQEARTLRLPVSACAFRQGEPAEHFYLLLQGRLKVTQCTCGGAQVVVRYVNPGDLFGLARAMRQPLYPACAVAVEDSVCLSWPAQAWPRFVALSPDVAGAVLQAVGQRLQDAHVRIQELSTEEVEQRVARAILRLVDQAGEQTDEGIAISFPITRQDIAETTGTTLHTVSRLLSAWQQRGLVVNRRKRVVVRRLDDLIRLSEGAADQPLNYCPMSMTSRKPTLAGAGPTEQPPFLGSRMKSGI